MQMYMQMIHKNVTLLKYLHFTKVELQNLLAQTTSIRHGWDRLVKRAGIKNLGFHDLRHEAVSRLF